VANITRVYRQAIDRVGASLQENKNSSEVIAALNKENRYDLEMGFSRGLYTGWFRGINNQELAHARFGKKRGFYLGEVTRVGRDSVFARLQGPAALGDGIVFDAGQPDQPEEGGRIYGLRNSGAEVELAFGHDSLDFTRIHRGDKIWKTNDPQLDKKIRLTYTGEKPNHQRDVSVEAHGSLNKPLSLLMQDTEGNVVHADSTILLQAAENRPITQESLMAQMGRLGGTEFKLKELKNFVEGQVMIPMSELNQLRRTLVEKLRVLRAEPKKWHLNGPEASWRGLFPVKAVEEKSTPELHILVRNLEQLETVLQLGTKTIYCEFEDPKKYREAVTMARLAFGCQSDRSIFVAPPRITKPGEEWILKQVRSAGADGYLVRNYDHLQYFKDERCVGDFSLNVANPITAKYYMDHFRLERLTASYDLNVDQLEGLLANCPGNWLEVTLHQHMPMFHMEHCVFCAFLSSGTDFKNCGRPCDTHKVSIKDRVGAEHPLKADAGCRNTVYNSRAQTGAEFWNDMQRFGVYQFRIEFLNETPAEVTQTITQYRKLLRGEIDGRQVWSELKLINQLGVTRGQMAGFKK
jgi:putative protease